MGLPHRRFICRVVNLSSSHHLLLSWHSQFFCRSVPAVSPPPHVPCSLLSDLMKENVFSFPQRLCRKAPSVQAPKAIVVAQNSPLPEVCSVECLFFTSLNLVILH